MPEGGKEQVDIVCYSDFEGLAAIEEVDYIIAPLIKVDARQQIEIKPLELVLKNVFGTEVHNLYAEDHEVSLIQ